MTMPFSQLIRPWSSGLLLLGLCCVAAVGAASAAKLPVKAQLVWGTDKDKPNDPRLKEVDPSLHDKLCKVFKWKNYFVVHTEEVTLTGPETKSIRMSPKCELKLRPLELPRLEVSLYGEGKLVVTRRQSLLPGHPLVLAGSDKNDTAWFVVLTASKP